MLLIGPEFVVCESAEANIVNGQNPYPTEFAATARSYLMVTLGLGAELKIPWAELDLRVPLSARVSVTPSVSDTRARRTSCPGASMSMISTCAERRQPMLGVCLGHQALGVVFGATVNRAPELLHGKTSMVHHDGTGVLRGLPSDVSVLLIEHHLELVDALADTVTMMKDGRGVVTGTPAEVQSSVTATAAYLTAVA